MIAGLESFIIGLLLRIFNSKYFQLRFNKCIDYLIDLLHGHDKSLTKTLEIHTHCRKCGKYITSNKDFCEECRLKNVSKKNK